MDWAWIWGHQGRPSAALGPLTETQNGQKTFEKQGFPENLKKHAFCFLHVRRLPCRQDCKFANFGYQQKSTKAVFKTAILELSCRRELDFQYFEENEKRKNACLQLQFFEDASCENAVFSDLTISLLPPWDNSKTSIFEGCPMRNHRKSIISRGPF